MYRVIVLHTAYLLVIRTQPTKEWQCICFMQGYFLVVITTGVAVVQRLAYLSAGPMVIYAQIRFDAGIFSLTQIYFCH